MRNWGYNPTYRGYSNSIYNWYSRCPPCTSSEGIYNQWWLDHWLISPQYTSTICPVYSRNLTILDTADNALEKSNSVQIMIILVIQ